MLLSHKVSPPSLAGLHRSCRASVLTAAAGGVLPDEHLIHRHMPRLRVIVLRRTRPRVTITTTTTLRDVVGGVVLMTPHIEHPTLPPHARLPGPLEHSLGAALDLQSSSAVASLPERTPLRLLIVPGQRGPLVVPPIPHHHMHGATLVQGEVTHGVGALVGVHVPRYHQVDAGAHQPFLNRAPHRLRLQLVVRVAVVERRVPHQHQPRRQRSVHPRYIIHQPLVLRGARKDGRVRAGQRDEVHWADVDAVP
mmetsp:Transcript_22931/g.40817  ORF Transcript_22931/g.40817 Transcript_22931/m.40817 type:complete len:251 (-) Transcript_22931:1064-1816(-)